MNGGQTQGAEVCAGNHLFEFMYAGFDGGFVKGGVDFALFDFAEVAGFGIDNLAFQKVEILRFFDVAVFFNVAGVGACAEDEANV